jgi:trehalose 6-phosphate phosphatase
LLIDNDPELTMSLEFNHADRKLADRFAVPDLRQCALLLDIDGTILDLAPAPQEVWVPTELRETLARLEDLTGGALALVSGRSLHDIDLIFSPLQLAAVGGHGAELRVVPGGEGVTRARELNPVLKRKLATLTELGPGILVEDKGYSLALHYRLAPGQGDALRGAIAEICATAPRGSVEVLPGKLVFEIKMAGINKAGAVRELMKYPPFKGRNPIFIGDDTTDEPVFPILSQFGGLGFSVGRVVADVNGHFDKPEAVRAWLSRIADNGQRTGKGTAS